MDTNPPSTGQLDGGTNTFRKQSCRSEFVAYSTWSEHTGYSLSDSKKAPGTVDPKTPHPTVLGGTGAPSPPQTDRSPGLLPLAAAAHEFPAEGCTVFAVPL